MIQDFADGTKYIHIYMYNIIHIQCHVSLQNRCVVDASGYFHFYGLFYNSCMYVLVQQIQYRTVDMFWLEQNLFAVDNSMNTIPIKCIRTYIVYTYWVKLKNTNDYWN